jgi:hypothetical protein
MAYQKSSPSQTANRSTSVGKSHRPLVCRFLSPIGAEHIMMHGKITEGRVAPRVQRSCLCGFPIALRKHNDGETALNEAAPMRGSVVRLYRGWR